MDADEADLAREFSGSVTLTLNEQAEVTLSPDQARHLSIRPEQTCPWALSSPAAGRTQARSGNAPLRTYVQAAG